MTAVSVCLSPQCLHSSHLIPLNIDFIFASVILLFVPYSKEPDLRLSFNSFLLPDVLILSLKNKIALINT